MFAFVSLSFVLTCPSAPGSFKTLGEAVEAIARQGQEDEAGARVIAAGKPGLWALHDAAKKKSGIERGRLFEAIGRFGTPEAEWALIVELKGADPQGVAGAIRGLLIHPNPKTFAGIVRQADAQDEVVRAAVVDALVKMGRAADAHVARLMEEKSPRAREVGLRYLARAGEGPIVKSAMLSALRDPLPAIQYQGLMIAGRTKDREEIFTVSELARSPDAEVACAAVQALHDIGGWSAASEISAAAADPSTREEAVTRAAKLLRTLGDDGFGAMLEAIARTRDDGRRAKLAKMAVENVKPEELARAVELLDDPSPARAEAGRSILMKSGEAGAAVASKRIPSALPELKEAIERYLSERTKQSEEDLLTSDTR